MGAKYESIGTLNKINKIANQLKKCNKEVNVFLTYINNN